MRLTKIQAVGLGILAALAVTSTCHGAVTREGTGVISPAHRAAADLSAHIALRLTTTEPRAFRECIRSGHRVYIPGTFIGRECRAADGETWYAGYVWHGKGADYQTGP